MEGNAAIYDHHRYADAHLCPNESTNDAPGVDRHRGQQAMVPIFNLWSLWWTAERAVYDAQVQLYALQAPSGACPIQ